MRLFFTLSRLSLFEFSNATSRGLHLRTQFCGSEWGKADIGSLAHLELGVSLSDMESWRSDGNYGAETVLLGRLCLLKTGLGPGPFDRTPK